MSDRLAEVEIRLAAMERRLAMLEGAGARVMPGAPAPALETSPVPLPKGLLSGTSAWLGRVLLIFGGAYLLRAITDHGILPTIAGIPLGAAYALFWLYMARRASSDIGARIYGAASLLMTLPILLEAVTRFDLLSGPQSAAALAVCCALYLAIAVLRGLAILAWMTAAGCALTAAMLLKITGATVSFTAFLALLGIATLWVVHYRPWRGLQWLGAAAANTGLVAAGMLSLGTRAPIEPMTAALLGLGLWAGYLLSFAARSHLQGRSPALFEAVQAILASAIAFTLALLAVRAQQLDAVTLGALARASGVGAYGLACTRATRAERGSSYYFYSTLGLALVIAGTALLLPPAWAAVAWSLLAVAFAWGSGRYGRVSLSLHCTLLLLAAAAGSGVLLAGLFAFVGSPVATWPAVTSPLLLVSGATVACLFIPVAHRSEQWGALTLLPQLLVLGLALWSVGGLLVLALAPPPAGVPGPAADPGTLAALRTTVLAGAAVTLTLSSRYRRWPEARWLAYPVLIALGLKLLFEDFPSGRPLTLFIALALVGGALIFVSRMLPSADAGAAPVDGAG
jgi:hypothetical protein